MTGFFRFRTAIRVMILVGLREALGKPCGKK